MSIYYVGHQLPTLRFQWLFYFIFWNFNVCLTWKRYLNSKERKHQKQLIPGPYSQCSPGGDEGASIWAVSRGLYLRLNWVVHFLLVLAWMLSTCFKQSHWKLSLFPNSACSRPAHVTLTTGKKTRKFSPQASCFTLSLTILRLFFPEALILL